MVNLKGSNPIDYHFIDDLVRNILLFRQQSWTQVHFFFFFCFFFARVGPFFFEKDYFSSQFYLFLAFSEIFLGLPTLPPALAI